MPVSVVASGAEAHSSTSVLLTATYGVETCQNQHCVSDLAYAHLQCPATKATQPMTARIMRTYC